MSSPTTPLSTTPPSPPELRLFKGNSPSLRMSKGGTRGGRGETHEFRTVGGSEGLGSLGSGVF